MIQPSKFSVEPNKTVAIQHIDKAKHFLKALQLLSKNNFKDLAISTGFYSLYRHSRELS